MNNTTVVPDGLRTMDIEQVNEYLEHLMKGKAHVGSELEQSALSNFKRISGRVDQLHSALGRAKAQVADFTAEINSANGELKAYANMLASAEDARRVKIEADAKKKADTTAEAAEAGAKVDARRAAAEASEVDAGVQDIVEPLSPAELVESDEDIQPESHEAVA